MVVIVIVLKKSRYGVEWDLISYDLIPVTSEAPRSLNALSLRNLRNLMQGRLLID